MTLDSEKFESLCKEYNSDWRVQSHIGTYNEKRLHLILKRMVTDRFESYEVKIGSYVADVLEDGHITEIQTGGLYPLRDKLGYYLSSTDYRITVIHPVIASKRILRVDKESGEVLRCRRSPRRIKSGEIFEEIYRIGEYVRDDRLEIIILYLSADEHRYSDEAVRYRKTGKYDSELFPQSILKYESFCGAEDYRYLLSDCPELFTAKEYGKLKGMSGRPLYSTLNLLCQLGLLSRRKKNSRSYEYTLLTPHTEHA